MSTWSYRSGIGLLLTAERLIATHCTENALHTACLDVECQPNASSFMENLGAEETCDIHLSSVLYYP